MSFLEEDQRTNIMRILGEALKAINEENTKLLKDLSNQTIHDASTVQDQYSITIAVLIYSLSKMFERETHYLQFKGWRTFCFDCIKGLEVMKKKLETGDSEGFDKALKEFMKHLKKAESKLGIYIQDVLIKARISKASRMHEHGVSIGRTSELLGITRFELMDYVGKTYIADMKENITIKAEKRLELARGLFR
ncbi:MAG TPA: hypothetical protein VJG30_04575 [Candidatus Nanoarchaeia archaeon]|nr:hypothetical protein [Candidatus Nanoarchaeia archaeon]